MFPEIKETVILKRFRIGFISKKMSFNPDPKKQTQEVTFSRKSVKRCPSINRFQRYCRRTISMSETVRHLLRLKTRYHCSYEREN